MRECGVGVDERRGHHEVLRDPVGILFRQSAQLVARDAVELFAGDLVGNRRVVMTRTIVVALGAVRAIGSGCARRPRTAVPRAGTLRLAGALGLPVAPRRAIALRASVSARRTVTTRSTIPLRRTIMPRGTIALRRSVTPGRTIPPRRTITLRRTITARAIVAGRALRAISHGVLLELKNRSLTRNGHPLLGGHLTKKSGGVLLSHEVTLAVPSAQKVLASGFGM